MKGGRYKFFYRGECRVHLILLYFLDLSNEGGKDPSSPLNL